MIRLLLASLMSKKDSTQQKLLEFANETVENMRRENNLVQEKEQVFLRDKEALYHENLQRELGRDTDAQERETEEELER